MYDIVYSEKAQVDLAKLKRSEPAALPRRYFRSKLKINHNLLGSLITYSYLCSKYSITKYRKDNEENINSDCGHSTVHDYDLDNLSQYLQQTVLIH